MHDPVTWYGINYARTQITPWDFKNKENSRWTGKSSFVLGYLRPNIIYSVPCDQIVQRAYWLENSCYFLNQCKAFITKTNRESVKIIFRRLASATCNPPQEKRWRLYNLPQCLASLRQSIRHRESRFFTLFIPVVRTLCSVGLVILKRFCAVV